jgi:hypothetical protein
VAPRSTDQAHPDEIASSLAALEAEFSSILNPAAPASE